jgi:Flp pilus assembly protein TadG
MICRRFLRDADGATAVEFALVSPIYFLGLFGLAQAGLWLWADFSLQRAVDVASRCAALASASNPLATGACPNTTNLTCTGSNIETCAATNTIGLPVTYSNFRVMSCGSGLEVQATYRMPTLVPALPDINVNVSACYPM